MISLTSEITDEVSFGRRDHHPVHGWSKYDTVPCLGDTNRAYEPTTQRNAMRNVVRPIPIKDQMTERT